MKKTNNKRIREIDTHEREQVKKFGEEREKFSTSDFQPFKYFLFSPI
jgi:hypothetical protein